MGEKRLEIGGQVNDDDTSIVGGQPRPDIVIWRKYNTCARSKLFLESDQCSRYQILHENDIPFDLYNESLSE